MNRVLESLVARCAEEVSTLKFLIHCALLVQRRGQAELSLNRGEVVSLRDPQAPHVDIDVMGFVSGLSETSKRYFYGLIEAVDIYQSIKGNSLRLESIGSGDPAVHELRQIRDLCMDDMLLSVY